MWSAVATALLVAAVAAPLAAQPVPYDIVYVRQPRFGDNTNTTWPEVAHPASIDPGADLMLLHPDGSEEVLVAGGVGAVTDPFVSFDAQWVYYSLFSDVRPQAVNYQRGLPYLRRRHLPHPPAEPPDRAAHLPGVHPQHRRRPLRRIESGRSPGQYDRLGYGILNLGPAPLAGGRIAFTSNRNGFVPPRGLHQPDAAALRHGRRRRATSRRSRR